MLWLTPLMFIVPFACAGEVEPTPAPLAEPSSASLEASVDDGVLVLRHTGKEVTRVDLQGRSPEVAPTLWEQLDLNSDNHLDLLVRNNDASGSYNLAKKLFVWDPSKKAYTHCAIFDEAHNLEPIDATTLSFTSLGNGMGASGNVRTFKAKEAAPSCFTARWSGASTWRPMRAPPAASTVRVRNGR